MYTKQIWKCTLTLLITVILIACSGVQKKNEVPDSGKTLVENGKKVKDSIEYTCDGCFENIKDTMIFKNIVNHITSETKSSLKYPLSFVPTEINLIISKKDSASSYRYFETNEIIPNLLTGVYKYSYIAKNGMGNELEGDKIGLVFIQDGRVTDLVNKIKLDDLKIEIKSDSNSKYLHLNRELNVSNNEGEFISFTPYFTKGEQGINLIVKSSYSCVDKGTSFEIELEDGNRIIKKSWNDFNCEGNSYFWDFSPKEKEFLSNSKAKFLMMYYKEVLLCPIPVNEADYFMQLIDLEREFNPK